MIENVTSKESLNRFLTTISAELVSLKRITSFYAPKLAPGFNSIDCFGPNENQLSAIIAMLLDPNGGHGHGTTFLDIFLELITPINECILQKRLNDLRNDINQEPNMLQSKCRLEVTTNYLDDDNKNRRIDILIDLNNFGLSIENKPWAVDQPRQIEDYYAHLSHKDNYGQNFLLIYLSGSGDPPNIESIKADRRLVIENSGHFLMMRYSELKKWCQRCAEKCQAPRLRYFLEDFTLYIRDNFEGRIPAMEEEVVIENALKPENVGAAVAVGFSWPTISRKLIENLAALSLKKARLDTNLWEFYVDFDLYEKDSYFYYVVKQKWNKYRISFAFDSKFADNFCYGVQAIPNSPEGNQLVLCDNFINEALVTGEKSPTWPWYKYFETPYRDWSKSEVPWVGISEGGKTVEIVADKILMLMDICERENLKTI